MQNINPTTYLDYGALGLVAFMVVIFVLFVWKIMKDNRKDIKGLSIKTDLRTDQIIEIAKDFSKVVEKNTSVIQQNNTVIEMCKRKNEPSQ